MKKIELFTIRDGMEKTLSTVENKKLGYAIAKNLRKIRPEIEDIESTNKPSEGYSEFSKKRTDLLSKYGKAQPIGGGMVNYIIDDSKKEIYEKENEKLRAEYSEEISKREIQNSEYEEFLKTEIDPPIEFFMFPYEDLPENFGGTIDPIFPIISEPKTETKKPESKEV